MLLVSFLILFSLSIIQVKSICYWGKYDFMFVLDDSLSIDDTEWERIEEFCNEFTKLLHISYFYVNVGIAHFSCTDEQILTLPLDHKKDDVVSFTESMPRYKAGCTNLDEGMELAYNELYGYGARDVEKVVLLLTDGATHHRDLDIEWAQKFEEKGAKVFGIGIGIQGSGAESHLQGLCSKEEYYWNVDDFQDLTGIIEAIANEYPCGMNPFLYALIWIPVIGVGICTALLLLALIGGMGLMCLMKYVPPPAEPQAQEKSMYYVAGKQMGISWGDKGLGMDSMYRPGDMGMGDEFGASKRTKFEGLNAKRESIKRLDQMDKSLLGKKKKKCIIL